MKGRNIKTKLRVERLVADQPSELFAHDNSLRVLSDILSHFHDIARTLFFFFFFFVRDGIHSVADYNSIWMGVVVVVVYFYMIG